MAIFRFMVFLLLAFFFFLVGTSILPMWIDVSNFYPHTSLLLAIAFIFPPEEKQNATDIQKVPLWSSLLLGGIMGYLEDLYFLAPKGLHSLVLLLIVSGLFYLRKYLLSPRGWFLVLLLGAMDVIYQMSIGLLSNWLIPKFYAVRTPMNFRLLFITLLASIPILWLVRKIDRKLFLPRRGDEQ